MPSCQTPRLLRLPPLPPPEARARLLRRHVGTRTPARWVPAHGAAAHQGMPLLLPLLVQARQQAIAVVIARPILVRRTNAQPNWLPVRGSITDIPTAQGQVIITTIIIVPTIIITIISSRSTGAIMAVHSHRAQSHRAHSHRAHNQREAALRCRALQEARCTWSTS